MKAIKRFIVRLLLTRPTRTWIGSRRQGER